MRDVPTLFLIPTAHDPCDHVLPVESVLTVEEAEGCEAPVDAVHAKMFGTVIRVVGFLQTESHEGGIRRKMRRRESKEAEEMERGKTDVVEGLNVFDVEI
jgi:hypothetical protein